MAQPCLLHPLSGVPRQAGTPSHLLPNCVHIQLPPRFLQHQGQLCPDLVASPHLPDQTLSFLFFRECQLPQRTGGGFPALTLPVHISSPQHQQSSAGLCQDGALAGPRTLPSADNEQGGGPREGLVLPREGWQSLGELEPSAVWRPVKEHLPMGERESPVFSSVGFLGCGALDPALSSGHDTAAQSLEGLCAPSCQTMAHFDQKGAGTSPYVSVSPPSPHLPP